MGATKNPEHTHTPAAKHQTDTISHPENSTAQAVNSNADQPVDGQSAAEPSLQESVGLSFSTNERGNRLLARYAPTPQMFQLNADQLREMLDEAGYDEARFPLFPDRVKDLIKGIEQRRNFEIELGGPVDAAFDIFVSPDQTLAGVQISPPLGQGLPPSRELFEQALARNKIFRGVDTQLIDRLFSGRGLSDLKHPCCYLIAFGKKPKDGRDGELQPLVEQMSERRPKVLQGTNDQVDFRELGDFPVIEAETPIFRLAEPVPGEDGFSVTGRTLKAYQGREKKVKTDSSLRPDYKDHRVYVSTVKGMPVFTDQGVHIENVLKLDEVNMGTGNIRFDGSIQIKQGVNPGMRVEASGDIKIGGLVDNATVISGGNIEIGGGVIGQKSPSLKATEPTKENAVVRAKGNIKARFIQDAWVESQAGISAQKLIMHSRLWAATSVKLPAAGQLIGGHVQAIELIEAGQLGTLASVPTLLEVGPLDAVRDEMSQVQKKLKEGFEQAKQLKLMIHRIREEKRRLSPEKKAQILKARDTISKALEALEQHRQSLEQEASRRRKTRIRALKKAYGGCNIVIADVSRTLKEDYGKCTFYLEGGEILLR